MRSAILLIAMLVTFLNVKAQDVITTKTGVDISAKIIEVTPGEIKYKRARGEIRTMNKADVAMIRYKGGRKEYFEEKPKAPGRDTSIAKTDTLPHTYDSVMAARGTADAKLFYRKYKAAENWTSAAAWLTTPVLGLVPAVACSVTPPKDKNLNCPYPDLLSNPDYRNAYREKAHKIKAGKTWIGYGIGTVIYLAIVAFLLNVVK